MQRSIPYPRFTCAPHASSIPYARTTWNAVPLLKVLCVVASAMIGHVVMCAM